MSTHPKTRSPLSPERALVGVVGAGTMGAGIAQVALQGGWRVALHDPLPNATDRALERIRKGLTRRAEKAGSGDPARFAAERLLDLTVVPNLAAVADEAQLVIEAAIEDLAVKRQLFAELGAAAAPETILATNTSALSVSSIAEAVAQPERLIGLHFFNPAPVLPLVEVVAGLRSAAWAVERGAAIAEGWDKTAIRVADSPGFIVNRVNRPFTLEPLRLLRSGAGTIESIDAALVQAGFPMGPFALMDLIGIDVNLAAARGLFDGSGRPPRFRPSPIQEELVAAGRLGRKAGEGFYRYADGKASGPAPRFVGVIRHGPGSPAPLEAEAIAERVILAIVNEAYRALGDRVATDDDIDRAMRLGANHPFGPFEWARRTGITEVAVMLDDLSDEDADTFRPSLPLLREARASI
ncbi:MAG TPA: 3-hydroxyacyl-CoA dehydrogenase NAD-binding domain-containing protein [Candidatus Limnocylindria bacterium]|nr:3-hydroxyacyl-CoA dehydrogenase NAD-binding domain-containing protein [Candidatus Limnocylindria bacterium]